MGLIQAAILGVVEGLTEFIPVSSTGHLIVAGELLGATGPAAKTFEIFIQLGAILAVAWLYRERFLRLLDLHATEGFAGKQGIWLLFLTTLPALVSGAFLHGSIKRHLFGPATVAWALLIGGIAILAVEKLAPQAKVEGLDALTPRQAFLIGCFQCLALWPGMSRSACTILGGMLLGADRKTAAEYSFLAAVPVMCAATVLDLAKSAGELSAGDIPAFAAGFAVALGSAVFAVRFFLKFVSTRTLVPFGWYRIAAAPLVYIFVP